jgi:pilus assembly protein CpaB
LNTRRLLVALFVALTLSAVFTYFVGRKVLGKAKKTNKYVVASKPLDAGEALKPANLEMVDWPEDIALPGGFQTADALNGRIVLYPLAKGEPIIERQLAIPGSGAGLGAKIPDGMRAISLKSDDVSGVAGFLLPGTHVDVLETDKAIGPTGRPNTTTVLQDVEILAAGQQMEPDPEGKPIRVPVVTLLLKPEDAQKVVQASAIGTIDFLLRNGADRTVVQVSATADEPDPKTGIRRRHVATSQAYLVETQMGDKKIVNSFN